MTTDTTSRASEMRAGFMDTLPLLLAIIPFGAISAVAAVSAGLDISLAIATSFIVFAGASQIAAMSLIESGAAWPAILGTALVINARMVMYSATLVKPLGYASRGWRWLMSYLMVDQVFALTVIRADSDTPRPNLHWYYTTVGVTAWIVWVAASAVGAIAGARVPDSWGLSFAAPLIFLALIFPTIVDRATFTAAIVAGVTAIAAAPLPYNLGLWAAAAAGIGAGLIAERTS